MRLRFFPILFASAALLIGCYQTVSQSELNKTVNGLQGMTFPYHATLERQDDQYDYYVVENGLHATWGHYRVKRGASGGT